MYVCMHVCTIILCEIETTSHNKHHVGFARIQSLSLLVICLFAHYLLIIFLFSYYFLACLLFSCVLIVFSFDYYCLLIICLLLTQHVAMLVFAKHEIRLLCPRHMQHAYTRIHTHTHTYTHIHTHTHTHTHTHKYTYTPRCIIFYWTCNTQTHTHTHHKHHTHAGLTQDDNYAASSSADHCPRCACFL
jgi:hypothetical protein